MFSRARDYQHSIRIYVINRSTVKFFIIYWQYEIDCHGQCNRIKSNRLNCICVCVCVWFIYLSGEQQSENSIFICERFVCVHKLHTPSTLSTAGKIQIIWYFYYRFIVDATIICNSPTIERIVCCLTSFANLNRLGLGAFSFAIYKHQSRQFLICECTDCRTLLKRSWKFCWSDKQTNKQISMHTVRWDAMQW